MFRFTIAILISMPMLTHAIASDSLTQQLQKIFDEHQLMGMSAIAVRDGDIVQSIHLGVSCHTRQIPVCGETHFRVASISKTFTAIAFMQLVEQGLADLDQDISTILGYGVSNPFFSQTSITPRMLLSHTSSLNDSDAYSAFLMDTYYRPDPLPIRELISATGKAYNEDIWLNKNPGSFFQYSNLAYGILGTLIEIISHTRFDQYVRENILLPMQITGSFNIQHIKDHDLIATLYRANNGNWIPQFDNLPENPPVPKELDNYIPGYNGLIFSPQGGLRISPADLSRVMIMLMNNGTWHQTQLIKQSTVQTMLEQQWEYDGTNGDSYNNLFTCWGLGLHLTGNNQFENLFNGLSMVGHSGNAYGLISSMYFDKDKKWGFIFITNGSKNPFLSGQRSPFYLMEEQVFEALFQSLTPFVNKKN
jgi:CubicO group peptidase (beta-lactamase class C family)